MSSTLLAYFFTACNQIGNVVNGHDTFKQMKRCKSQTVARKAFTRFLVLWESPWKRPVGLGLEKSPAIAHAWLAVKLGVLARVQCKGEFQELVHIFVIFQLETHASSPGRLCSLGAASKLVVRKAKAPCLPWNRKVLWDVFGWSVQGDH